MGRCTASRIVSGNDRNAQRQAVRRLPRRLARGERRVERVWYALAPEGVKTEVPEEEETVKKTAR